MPDLAAHSPTDADASRQGAGRSGVGWACGVLICLAFLVWGVRISGYSDLIDNDQTRPSTYAMDVVLNGSWAVQKDFTGAIASKPPLTVWISSFAWHSSGEQAVQRWAVTVPGLLGVCGILVVVVVWGQRWFGGHAGMWGGFGVLFSISGEKILALVRTDGLFAFTVSLVGLAAWNAWRTGRGWTWFWMACAIATLTKGPLGVLLGGIGLLAIVWERIGRKQIAGEVRAEPRGGRVLLDHAVGIAAFLLITGGWFYLAWRAEGEAFINKVIGDELIGHALESDKGDPPFTNFYKAPLYLLAYYAPLSIVAVLGLIRVLRRREVNPDRRRLERFLWCWLVGGLTIFAIAPHQRPDLLAPLWCPMALLGGREVDGLLRSVASRTQWLALGVLGAVLIGGSIWHRHFAVADDRLIVAEGHLRAAAEDWESRGYGQEALLHTTDHSMFRLHLGKYRRSVGFDEAVELLRSGEAELVAVSTGREEFEAMLAEAGLAWDEIAFYDANTQRHRIWILRVGRDSGGAGD